MGVVPTNVSTKLAPEAQTWSAPALNDFTDKAWGDLTAAEQTSIAGHYAWASAMPPPTFGDLKLPHHDPKTGSVVWAGVAGATARLNQSDIPSADLGRVKAHLRAHYKAFEKDPPEALKEAAPRHHRAYSLLHVKSVDAQQRTITGIATTPTPDRMGDVIEPLGVTFKNPLPLLLYHNPQKPVGQVRFKLPTAEGIAFEAHLPTVHEPGLVKDRIDEAWHSLNANPPLIGGVSIGFRSIEENYLKETQSFHFLQTEVLELSLVVIPANPDATIQTVKSLDLDPAAMSRRAAVASIHPAGGSATRPVVHVMTRDGRMPKKTLIDQIREFEATRQAKSARMIEIMEQAGEAGTTLDESQQQEYDGLADEVKALDAHLVRLADLEKANKAAAKPVAGSTGDEGSRARAGLPVITVKDQLPPGMEFTRYAICLMVAKGNTTQALEIAKARYPDQERIHAILKSAVAAGTTMDPNWAGNLVFYQNLVSEFIEFLRPATIIGKFGMAGIPSLRRIPFNVRITGQTSGGTGYWVGQGAAKPLTKVDFEAVTLRWAKVAAISVLSEELVRFSSPSAEALVREALRQALVERLDIDFIDPAKAAVADVSPASITNGISALTPTGTDLDAVTADIRKIFAPFLAANLTPTNGVWIMSNTTALALSLMRTALGEFAFPEIKMDGGTFHGLPVVASQYAALGGSPVNQLVILVNASDIFLSDDGQVVIDVSNEASLQMDSSPSNTVATGSPLAPAPTDLVSLWQTNSIGLRAERFINWARRRPAAVAYFNHVAWGTA